MNNLLDAKAYDKLIKQFSKGGAFLTSKNNEEVNTMTIGWANMGIIWAKPIITIAVRYSRYTYDVLDPSDCFTISVPAEGELKNALIFCGTKSGKEYDKFKECSLTLTNSQYVDAPIINECPLHFECKIVYKQAIDPGNLNQQIKENSYANKDFHVLYYGEILNIIS